MGTESTSYEVTPEEVEQAYEELFKGGSTNKGKGVEENEDGTKTGSNAKTEDEGEGEGDDKPYFKPFKKAGNTVYRRMQKGKDGSEKFADKNYYKYDSEAGDYKTMDHEEIAGMFESSGGGNKMKSDKTEKGEGSEEEGDGDGEGEGDGEGDGTQKGDEGEGDPTEKGDEGDGEEEDPTEKGGEGDGDDDDDVQKAIDAEPVLKSFHNELRKVEENLEGFKERHRSVSEHTGKILKGLMEKVDALNDKIEAIGSEPVRKSAGVSEYRERFEKGEEGEGGGEDVLSLTKDRGAILNELEGMAIQKGEVVDTEIADELGKFESSGELSDGAVRRLQQQTGKKVVQ